MNKLNSTLKEGLERQLTKKRENMCHIWHPQMLMGTLNMRLLDYFKQLKPSFPTKFHSFIIWVGEQESYLCEQWRFNLYAMTLA
jgi:hypothetical protein